MNRDKSGMAVLRLKVIPFNVGHKASKKNNKNTAKVLKTLYIARATPL
jgi:hypothetical protein